MRKKSIYKLLFIYALTLISFYKTQAQGCSDAGFCTAGTLKPQGKNTDTIGNSLGFTIGYGIGEQGTKIYTPQFEPQIKVSSKSMIQLKIPFVYIKGKITNKMGLGDVILTYNYLLDTTWKKPVTLTIGSRIGTGTAAEKSGDIPLPMPYQLGLGTTDIIIGAKINIGNGFTVSVGFQQPLFNRNMNDFDSAAFKALAEREKLNPEDNFFISSHLKRKGDIMVRLDKVLLWKNITFNAGLLPIYHLGKDKVHYSDSIEVELQNSNGLTLNINAGLIMKISDHLEWSVMGATPLIVRKSRPDGLTRSLVIAMGLRYFL